MLSFFYFMLTRALIEVMQNAIVCLRTKKELREAMGQSDPCTDLDIPNSQQSAPISKQAYVLD